MAKTLNNYINEILQDKSIKETIDSSILNLTSKVIAGENITFNAEKKEDHIRLTALLLNSIMAAFQKGEELNSDIVKQTVLLLNGIDLQASKDTLKCFNDYIGIDSVHPIKVYYFYVALLGLLSGDVIKTRLDLKNYSLSQNDTQDWGAQVIAGCMDAFILLVRKDNGFDDIALAIKQIDNLKSQQKTFEEKYLQSKEENEKISHAYNLVGIYHVSKILVETANYLIYGYSYKGNLRKVISLHKEFSLKLLQPSSKMPSLAIAMFKGCITLQENSIWFKTEGLGSNIEKLCIKLAKQNIIDLLPSQQQALNQNLLDNASNVAVVQMPTSAGKTLLAEFTMLQTLSLKSESKIVYVVPTRALANQIHHDLSEDFSDFNFTIEKTSKVNEIDPSEDLFLKEDINILITTPEKLDLLIRRSHPSVEDISLVVIDEAHNLTEGERGARLELLLVMLKRERSKARFLLLSPFLKNAQTVSKWLAEGRTAINPIRVDWKPSEKILSGIVENKGQYSIELLPSAHGFERVTKSEIIPLENVNIKSTGKKKQMLELMTKYLSDDQNCNLYLCWGKKTSEDRALEISEFIDKEDNSELLNLASKFIQEEVGTSTVLSNLLKKRIAIHHSGLTEEVKLLIEYLIKNKEINHICATTTIAQGINFPISSVYIDDMRKGRQDRLSINEFLNIAGRAGRTLVDSYGKVFFPFNSTSSEENAKKLISQEASAVTSVLTSLIDQSEEITKAFTGSDSEIKNEIFRKNESLGVLIQYLVHLLNVVDATTIATEIDTLFKDSLGYYSLQNEEQRSKFITMCRSIFNDLQQKQGPGILSYADKTGFSVPSVLKIMYENRTNQQISAKESWNPDILFNSNNSFLAEKINVIGKLREVQLGTESDVSKFNPKVVADVLIKWVKGEKISDIALNHPAFMKKDASAINEFVKYLNHLTFRSSWGLSALEGICLSKDDKLAENSSIPSMVYFGVDTKEAVATRMIGVPRAIAPNMAKLIYKKNTPNSYSQLRKDMHGLTNTDWDSIVPKGSKLNGAEWKQITSILAI